MNGLAGLLHISRKAGKILFGRTAVFARVKSGRDVLVLIASDAGSALTRRLDGPNIMKINMTSAELGEVFAREKLSLVGITDSNLAAAIRRLIKRESREPSADDRIWIKYG